MIFLGKEIKLAIFDLDGTLIDSTSIWADIDRMFFAKRGMEIPPSYGIEIAHVGLNKAAEITKEKYLPNENVEDIKNEWLKMSYEAYRDTIPLKKGALELLKILRDNGVTIALATANSKDIYEPCLTRLEMFEHFATIMDVNSCKEGKNSPEIYDRIAKLFNATREETVVFEDMIVPIITAFNAGYNVVGVYDKDSTKDEQAVINHSQLYIKNYEEIINLLK
ncbi:MAG: HAD family phosphatase [Bacilli bacterium]|nr:HAD family phosphatase [Bacilli bacterium]